MAGWPDEAREVTVTGYTDTAGSKEAHALLSATRAQVVADQLVADGVPASRVHQVANGATNHAQTPLESRRVVISVAGP